jgi:hypothetical protein
MTQHPDASGTQSQTLESVLLIVDPPGSHELWDLEMFSDQADLLDRCSALASSGMSFVGDISIVLEGEDVTVRLERVDRLEAPDDADRRGREVRTDADVVGAAAAAWIAAVEFQHWWCFIRALDRAVLLKAEQAVRARFDHLILSSLQPYSGELRVLV